MKDSKLLKMLFDYDNWVKAMDKANDKKIDLTVMKQLAIPKVRAALYVAIKNGNYHIIPPHEIQIPKDDGTMRTVYANEEQDRILLTLITDCVMKLFADMIHPNCVSYQEGIGTQDIVKRISKEIVKQDEKINERKCVGFVSDFTKYFDTVSMDKIDEIFDTWEKRLGFEKDMEPVINMLREYYHNPMYFDLDGNLQEKYMSLRQGCALAAPLSCMVLYELDDYMSKKYKIYYRYSDDCLTIDNNTESIVEDINRICTKYGTCLNPKKIKPVYTNQWFKFLGFNIKGNMITLSKNRVKKFQKEIVSRTIAKPYISPKDAKENVKRFLYGNGDGYSWATSCFSALQNCDEDINVLNNFIMDALRICESRWNYNKKRKENGQKERKIIYKMKDIGGIGSVMDMEDRTLIRGTGKKVKSGRQRTEKEINGYLSIGCLLKTYRMGKPIYETCVRSM